MLVRSRTNGTPGSNFAALRALARCGTGTRLPRSRADRSPRPRRKGRFRRVSPIAPRPREGPPTEPTDGVSRRPRHASMMSARPLSLTIVDLRSADLDPRGRSDKMVHFAGLDVSVKATSVCGVDDAGKVVLERKNTDRAGRYHRRSDLAWCVRWPDRDRGWSAVTVAGQWVDGGQPAGGLRGDAAHEGFADGAANQQDGPQGC